MRCTKRSAITEQAETLRARKKEPRHLLLVVSTVFHWVWHNGRAMRNFHETKEFLIYFYVSENAATTDETAQIANGKFK